MHKTDIEKQHVSILYSQQYRERKDKMPEAYNRYCEDAESPAKEDDLINVYRNKYNFQCLKSIHTMNAFRGFSLIEMIIVILIIGVLGAAGTISYKNIIKDHKLTQYAADMEYTIKHAKLIAIEKTTNVGVCVSTGTELKIYDLTTTRPSFAVNSCPASGVTTLSSMSIVDSDNTGFNITLSGSSCSGGYPMGCVSFDPRGLAIWTGNLCVTNGRKYFKTVIDRASIRTQEGAGGCS